MPTSHRFDAEMVEERAVNLNENQQSFPDNPHPILARGTGFGQVQNNNANFSSI